MSDPMAEIRASFFIECDELLESLFDALQSMSDGSSDAETINVAFRAVHSIKGGAGAFALDDLVSFAHHFETVMDDLRDGRLDLAPELVNLFFRCGDILSDLVAAARDGNEPDTDTISPVVEELKTQSSGAGAGDSPEADDVPDFQPMALDFDDLDLSDLAFDEGESSGPIPDPPADSVGVEHEIVQGLTIKFRPEPELYESGNEPLFLLRSLSDLGPCQVSLAFEPADSFDAHAKAPTALCWTIKIETTAAKIAIDEIFEFVNGLCVLEVREIKATTERNSTGEGELDRNHGQEIEDSSGSLDRHPVSATDQREGTVSGPEPSAAPEQSISTEAAAATAATKPNATVRVDLGRIDRLVNLVGELVINQAMLSQSAIEAGISANTSVSNGLDEFLQLTRDIQESVMMIRAQPVKSLFQRMSRIVREASAAVDKKVTLVTEGETTEIDKTVIERLSDPLTHMIRNAVDHGLESTDERIAAGKNETGCVRLTATHKSGRVVIEVGDDGGGINREKVRNIAIEKDLLPSDAQLTDAEIDQLLFLPGFSTANSISNLSGRGVGMDVVKNAITALGGRISIQSTAGAGTSFSISLPLTLAVLDGMVVSVAGETLVMPLNAIAETLTLTEEDIRSLGARTSVVLVREDFVPLIDLGVALGYRQPLENYAGSIALLVGQDDGSKAALVVDAIDDQRQVVIKGLQESYGRVSGVAAATILGDGQIALILDASDLMHTAMGAGQKQKLLEVI